MINFEELKEELLARGASLVGFADLKDVPYDNRKGFPYGISIAVAYEPAIIKGILKAPTREYEAAYNRLNDILDGLGEYTAATLVKMGNEAYPLTTYHVEEDESTWTTALPHKTSATRSGLGWIGKCALLVTKSYGSAIRLTTVLTNAPLPCGTPANESLCGSCTRCVEVCPASAILGDSWDVKKERDSFYKAHDCRRTARERAGRVGINKTLCGLCIAVCPWTERYLNSKHG